MGEANFINALLSRRPILSVHTHMSSIGAMRGRIEASAVSVLIRRLYRRAIVVAVSEAVKRDLVDGFGVPDRQVVVIPNAVDVAKVTALAREEAQCPWDPQVPVIVTAGRMSQEKGQWHLVRAFAEVRKARPCQLAIIGTGDLESYLKRLAAELGIADSIFFLGWQPNPFQFMVRADLFVLPSLTESFGLALLEAMVCRLPVIATDCPGGSREIITEATGGPCGVLVPALDGVMRSGSDPVTDEERQLADRIMQVLDDRAARETYVARALPRAREFDIPIFVDKYERLIERAAAGAF
jgi:glycosyltransferase involved in cell wall biosynthesis